VVPTVFLDLADSGSQNHDIEFSIIPQTWGVSLATIEWVDGDGLTHEVSNNTSSPVVTGTFAVDQSEDFQSWGAIATFNVVNCGSGQTTTTTEGATTSTTVSGSVSPSSTAQAPTTLPRTGSSNATLSWLAAAALLTGTGFLVTARRIRESR
jgi:LPXTG-motif cell wall-anchored protein